MNDIADKPQHIITLDIENVKRLKAARLYPNGDSLFVIGGNNAQGKSSCLDAIIYALCGTRAECEMPIREGQSTARVVMETEDLIVTKRWFEGGKPTLTVTAKDGRKYSSPQTLLDSLIGRVALDPLSFMRQDAKTQAETLRKVLGIDTTEQDEERQDLYDRRTLVNRQHDAARARADSTPRYADAGFVETPLGPIMEKIAALNSHNAEVSRAKDAAAAKARELADDEAKIKRAEDEIARIERELAKARTNRDMLIDSLDIEARRKAVADALAAADLLQPDDAKALTQELNAAQDRNAKARANATAKAAIEEAAKFYDEADALTQKIKAIDEAKREAISAATSKLPIKGLTYEDGTILFNGKPLAQASTAEQIEISCAIGLLCDPKLRLLIVREGSALDENALALLASIARKYDAQVIMERVGKGKEASVIIEDGEVEGRAE